MGKKGKYIEPKRTRIGKNLFVCGFDKHPINGLSWDKGNGTYYYTFFASEKDFKMGVKTRKDYSFGSDYQSAIFAYKSWAKDNSHITLDIPDSDAELKQTITKKLTPKEQQGLQQIYKDLGSDKEASSEITFGGEGWQESEGYTIKNKLTTNKQYALHFLKQLLQDEEIKIEAIRLLKLNDLLPKEHKILSVKEVLSFYMDNNDCLNEEKRKVKKAIEAFIRITKKKTINTITEDDIDLFKNSTIRSQYSTTVINGMFGRLKTVLNFYNKNKNASGEKELVRKVLDYCSILIKVDDIVKDPPKSLDVKTVQQILTAAKDDKELLLMFLLMLNTGYTCIDLRTLTKDRIKVKGNLTYILFSRTKTKKMYKRVNCLWDITAKLLKKQCCQNPNTNFVFITEIGSPYAECTLSKKFAKFFTIINKPEIKPKHFKDTVATELAFKVNVNILKVTIGHSLGKASSEEFWKYIDSLPEKQKPAIDILYKKFQKAIEGIRIRVK